jgi:hypothetical protein
MSDIVWDPFATAEIYDRNRKIDDGLAQWRSNPLYVNVRRWQDYTVKWPRFANSDATFETVGEARGAAC